MEDVTLEQFCVLLKTAGQKVSKICTDLSRYHHFITPSFKFQILKFKNFKIKFWYNIDWFKWHVNLFRVILC